MLKIILFIIVWLVISIIGGIIGGWLGPYTTGFRNYPQKAFMDEENNKENGENKLDKKDGFTLIELLIVVAIIGILAAIAVPNFLNAQVRARVARGKSDIRTMENVVMMYMLDNNSQRPIDCDDPGSATYLGGLGCGTENNGAPADIKGVPEFTFAPKFMSFSQLRIFTTPVAYISGTQMQDTFGSNCALTYNTRYSGRATQAESYTFSLLGPDKMTGDWGFFFNPGGNPEGLQYDSSNGLNSRGDIFVSNVFSDIDSNRQRGGRISY